MKVLKDTLKLRALLFVSTLGVTWLVTGNPITSVSVTAIQQTTNFGIQYWWEKNKTQETTLQKKIKPKGDYQTITKGKIKWKKW